MDWEKGVRFVRRSRFGHFGHSSVSQFGRFFPESYAAPAPLWFAICTADVMALGETKLANRHVTNQRTELVLRQGGPAPLSAEFDVGRKAVRYGQLLTVGACQCF